MTCGEAIKRFEREAQRLRAQGLHAAAHDWQRWANEMRRLEGLANSLRANTRRSTP